MATAATVPIVTSSITLAILAAIVFHGHFNNSRVEERRERRLNPSSGGSDADA